MFSFKMLWFPNNLNDHMPKVLEMSLNEYSILNYLKMNIQY
jgi:hypothetical protein